MGNILTSCYRARSGFCFIPCNDGVILYGGYCKQYTKGQRAKGIVHTGKKITAEVLVSIEVILNHATQILGC